MASSLGELERQLRSISHNEEAIQAVPLLREYWFDNPKKSDHWIKDLQSL